VAAAKKTTKKPAKKTAKRKRPAQSNTGLGGHAHGRTRATPKKKTKSGKPDQNIRVGTLNAAILAGEVDLSEWDDEELLRGQRRNRNGNFQGRPPKVVPKQLHDELVRRTLEYANEELRSNLQSAVQMLTSIATDPRAEDRDKIKAIEMVMNRVMGKAPDRVELTAQVKPYEEVLRGGVVRDLPEDDDE
jgi:hypothetical protein